MTREEFVEFVRAARMGVVATVDASGDPEAALVDLAVTDAGEIVFDSLATARKVANIGHHARVAVVVGWTDGVSVQIEGDARVRSGDDLAAYRAIHHAQLHKGRTLRDDFTVVTVVPSWLRYYDARPESFGMVEGSWE